MAATWTPITGAARSVSSLQALTETAPTGSDGIQLDVVKAVGVTIHAPGGQTFTGAGILLGYFRRGGVWVPAPRANIPLDEIAGLSDADLPPLPVNLARDRFALIASGVGVSGGTQITMELYAIAGPGTEAV